MRCVTLAAQITLIGGLWSCAALGSAAHAQNAAPHPAPGEAAPYVIDPTHTRIHWEVMHFGTSTSRGRFDDIDGAIRWSRRSGQGEVSISVGTASVNTGVGLLDAALRGENFLQSKDHPRAYFVARDWRSTSGVLSQVRGELTLRGQTLPLTLRALRFQCARHPTHGKEVCGGDFEAVLLRSDFGISYGLPLVADRVRLVIQIEASEP